MSHDFFQTEMLPCLNIFHFEIVCAWLRISSFNLAVAVSSGLALFYLKINKVESKLGTPDAR